MRIKNFAPFAIAVILAVASAQFPPSAYADDPPEYFYGGAELYLLREKELDSKTIYRWTEEKGEEIVFSTDLPHLRSVSLSSN